VGGDHDALREAVRGFLAKVLGVDLTGVQADTGLLVTGLVDSVGLVRLAAFLETELGIAIPDRDVTLEHFGSLAAIEAYVGRRLATRA
jgi:acyl carrier protein